MFTKHDIRRDACQLYGKQAKRGYHWYWHSFTGHNEATGEEKAFFVEFFLCNPAFGKDEPVFGIPYQKEPSYLMVKAGCWGKDARQLDRFFGWKRIYVDYHTPFKIEADDCVLTETMTKGSVYVNEEESKRHPEWMSENGSMSWNLIIKKEIAFNVGYGAGSLFRKLQLFEMFWHAEGMKTEYSGTVIYNGDRYQIEPDSCYGYADSNWGEDFTSPWVWLSSNHLISQKTKTELKNSVFDIGGGCPKIGPLSLPRKLLSAFYYEGKPYEFNFSKFWTFTRTEFDCRETEDKIIWHVKQRNLRNTMITDIECEKENMLLIRYEAPNGTKLHTRLWNGGNGHGTVRLYNGKKLIDTIECYNVGCEYGE